MTIKKYNPLFNESIDHKQQEIMNLYNKYKDNYDSINKLVSFISKKVKINTNHVLMVIEQSNSDL